MRERFRPGTATVITSESPSSSFGCVFEDDGVTGYFYAVDRHSGAGILDAVHIYHVPNLLNRDRDSEAEVQWSSDGLKAGLFINDQLHAIIDFDARIAYGRSNYPPPAGAWAGVTRIPWRDDLAGLLR